MDENERNSSNSYDDSLPEEGFRRKKAPENSVNPRPAQAQPRPAARQNPAAAPQTPPKTPLQNPSSTQTFDRAIASEPAQNVPPAAQPKAPARQSENTGRPQAHRPITPENRPAANTIPTQPQKPQPNAAPAAPSGRPAPKKSEKPATVVKFTDDDSRTSDHSGVRSLVKALVYIAAVVIVSVVLSYIGITVSNDVFAFVKEDDEVTIEIPEYMTTGELADILAEAGVIKYPWVFKLYNGRNDSGVEFVAGTYTVSTNTSYDELFTKFQKSTVREIVRVAIPEGYTADEIIGILVENGIGTREGFVEVINNYDFSSFGYKFLEGLTVPEDRTYRLEGYLYPDTYDFYKARGLTEDDDIYVYTDEVVAISKFLDRFNRVFTEELYTRVSDLGMTVDEVVTLASIIEKEGKYVSEFEDISSVFHNRLKYSKSFPHLESDATIAYAIQMKEGKRPDKIESEDKYYDSPYNTYLCNGLPPGPIANPGYNAITCALYPSSTNYFFFVSQKDGTSLFAATLAEHEENIKISRGEISAKKKDKKTTEEE